MHTYTLHDCTMSYPMRVCPLTWNGRRPLGFCQRLAAVPGKLPSRFVEDQHSRQARRHSANAGGTQKKNTWNFITCLERFLNFHGWNPHRAQIKLYISFN